MYILHLLEFSQLSLGACYHLAAGCRVGFLDWCGSSSCWLQAGSGLSACHHLAAGCWVSILDWYSPFRFCIPLHACYHLAAGCWVGILDWCGPFTCQLETTVIMRAFCCHPCLLCNCWLLLAEESFLQINCCCSLPFILSTPMPHLVIPCLIWSNGPSSHSASCPFLTIGIQPCWFSFRNFLIPQLKLVYLVL